MRDVNFRVGPSPCAASSGLFDVVISKHISMSIYRTFHSQKRNKSSYNMASRVPCIATICAVS